MLHEKHSSIRLGHVGLDSLVLTSNWAGQKLRKSVPQVGEPETPNSPVHCRKPLL